MQKKITIRSFKPLQLGKVFAVLYGLMAVIFAPLFFGTMALSALASQGDAKSRAFGIGFGIFIVVLMPAFYAVFGFLTGVVGGFIYNRVAKWVGGIELEVEAQENPTKS